MNYEKIKACALAHGCRTDELLAMDRANDPFYCGQPAAVVMADPRQPRQFAERLEARECSR